MIHERNLNKTLHVDGPLTTRVATVTALHEIEASIAIQNERFENLIRGSKVKMDEVLTRAPGNSRRTKPSRWGSSPTFTERRGTPILRASLIRVRATPSASIGDIVRAA
jgi:hypothetical protein